MSKDENKFQPIFHSTHQECMIFARIGHGPCYYHWNEIFAGVHMVRARIPELVISESINCLRLKRRRKITESTG